MKRRLLGTLAYMLPTFPLGYFWHLVTFDDYYESLEVYRENILVPLGIGSMIIQGYIWSFIYEHLFAGESIPRGAIRFAAVAFPIAWSFMVLAVGAKHPMTSVGGYLVIETAFLAVQYAVVSPLIAAVYADQPKK
jgi:hypothetical protein